MYESVHIPLCVCLRKIERERQALHPAELSGAGVWSVCCPLWTLLGLKATTLCLSVLTWQPCGLEHLSVPKPADARDFLGAMHETHAPGTTLGHLPVERTMQSRNN